MSQGPRGLTHVLHVQLEPGDVTLCKARTGTPPHPHSYRREQETPRLKGRD